MEAADAARARSLRASIAGLMRALRERNSAAPAPRPRGAWVDAAAAGTEHPEGPRS